MQEEILVKLINEQSNGFIILNKDLEVLYANNKVKGFFLSDINQLLGDFLKCNYTILEDVHCQNTSHCKRCILNNTIKKVKETYNTVNLDNIKYNSNGKRINISLRISHVNDYIVIEFVDLCNLYEEVNFLARMMDKSKDIMYFKDSKLRYRYINKSCAEFFNREKNEIINKDDIELVNNNLLDKSLYLKLRNGDLNALKTGYYSEVLSYSQKYLNISKEIIDDGILCIATDITEAVEANKRSEVDFLTNLYNRRKFINSMDEILSNKDEDDYYLALIDLDDLRNLNNIYGHLKGDKYLSKLGEILSCYNEGMFFRIGGDEFAGLIQGDDNHVESVFNSIFKDLNDLNYEPPLSISVGIKKINISKSYIENYKEVDALLYKLKESGKNAFKLI